MWDPGDKGGEVNEGKGRRIWYPGFWKGEQ